MFNVARTEFGASLSGLLIGGSIARGDAREDSDIDVFLTFQGNWRQRRRLTIDHKEIDLFINPAEVVLSSIKNARDEVLTENYAEGWIIYDPDGVVEDIQRVAQRVLTQPWHAPTHLETFVSSNRLKDTLRAVLESGDSDELVQRYLINRFVEAAVGAYYLFTRQIRPAAKRIPADLALRAEDAHVHLSTILGLSSTRAERSEAAERLCDAVFARCESARDCSFGPKLPVSRRAK